jgi:hypothetical protein
VINKELEQKYMETKQRVVEYAEECYRQQFPEGVLIFAAGMVHAICLDDRDPLAMLGDINTMVMMKLLKESCATHKSIRITYSGCR